MDGAAALRDLAVSLTLGVVAGATDVAGGLLLARRSPSPSTLRVFVALGAGFMLSAALLEMIPQALAVHAPHAALLILLGYCLVHLLEHAVLPHIHVGAPTHAHDAIAGRTGSSVLFGLACHTFFDGVAIGSGFALSTWLGWIIFSAVVLHKLPEGLTMASVMLAAERGRRAAVLSTVVLACTTVAGVLVIGTLPQLVRFGLQISAGVTVYVAASDLVPEVNRAPSVRTAAGFFAGVTLFLVLERFAAV